MILSTQILKKGIQANGSILLTITLFAFTSILLASSLGLNCSDSSDSTPVPTGIVFDIETSSNADLGYDLAISKDSKMPTIYPMDRSREVLNDLYKGPYIDLSGIYVENKGPGDYVYETYKEYQFFLVFLKDEDKVPTTFSELNSAISISFSIAQGLGAGERFEPMASDFFLNSDFGGTKVRYGYTTGKFLLKQNTIAKGVYTVYAMVLGEYDDKDTQFQSETGDVDMSNYARKLGSLDLSHYGDKPFTIATNSPLNQNNGVDLFIFDLGQDDEEATDEALLNAVNYPMTSAEDFNRFVEQPIIQNYSHEVFLTYWDSQPIWTIDYVSYISVALHFYPSLSNLNIGATFNELQLDPAYVTSSSWAPNSGFIESKYLTKGKTYYMRVQISPFENRSQMQVDGPYIYNLYYTNTPLSVKDQEKKIVANVIPCTDTDCTQGTPVDMSSYSGDLKVGGINAFTWDYDGSFGTIITEFKKINDIHWYKIVVK